MANAEKLLARMRVNPRDWRIDDLKVVARHWAIHFRQHGTSHVTFVHGIAGLVTVPAARPVKPVYVRHFLAMVDKLGGIQ